MSVFHRNRHESTARPYVSWTPSTEPVDPAADASATVSPPQIPTDAAVAPEKPRERPAPDER
jgi:hypothetical protein